MIPMSSSMADDTDVCTGTSTDTKSHKIPLHNYLNMTNAMVSLMALSASYVGKHGIATCICQKLTCHMQFKYAKAFMCRYEITVSVYMPHIY